jgi:hypothetical protein
MEAAMCYWARYPQADEWIPWHSLRFSFLNGRSRSTAGSECLRVRNSAYSLGVKRKGHDQLSLALLFSVSPPWAIHPLKGWILPAVMAIVHMAARRSVVAIVASS